MFVAGTALAVGPSYVMYLGHILLWVIASLYICQTHFQNHVSTTVRVSWNSVHRNADAALGADFLARIVLQIWMDALARWQGQAMFIWRNTPASGEAETYIPPFCFLAWGGPLKHQNFISGSLKRSWWFCNNADLNCTDSVRKLWYFRKAIVDFANIFASSYYISIR